MVPPPLGGLRMHAISYVILGKDETTKSGRPAVLTLHKVQNMLYSIICNNSPYEIILNKF